MNPRRPGDPPRPTTRLRRKDFPALADFFAGYLHEDLLPEHGSAGAAAGAFRADATVAERRKVQEELKRLLARTEGWSTLDLQRAVAALGAAWIPAARVELEELVARWDDD
jgi:hypothetical protein